jgi:hypothetical protein
VAPCRYAALPTCRRVGVRPRRYLSTDLCLASDVLPCPCVAVETHLSIHAVTRRCGALLLPRRPAHPAGPWAPLPFPLVLAPQLQPRPMPVGAPAPPPGDVWPDRRKVPACRSRLWRRLNVMSHSGTARGLPWRAGHVWAAAGCRSTCGLLKPSLRGALSPWHDIDRARYRAGSTPTWKHIPIAVYLHGDTSLERAIPVDTCL